MAKKILLGALIFVILTSSFYIMLPEQVKIIFEDTRTVFKVYTGSKYETSAVEYVRVFDGSKKMLADSRANTYLIYEGIDPMTNTIVNFTNVTKTAYMKRDGVRVEQLYHFNGMTEDKAMVPVSERICFYNGSGKIFEWLIKDITYTGVTKDIISPFAFGMNMEVEFQDGYYRAKVYNNLVAPDKIIVRYRIPDDDECYDVRLFDPCTTLSDNTPVTLVTDTVLCEGQDVQINQSAIQISANLNLNCNGSIIRGNKTSNRHGISATTSLHDINITNCIIEDKDFGFRFAFANQVTVENSRTNRTSTSVYLAFCNNATVRNSTFEHNSGSAILLWGNHSTFDQLRFFNYTNYGIFFDDYMSHNSTITNSVFEGIQGLTFSAIGNSYPESHWNTTIENNTFSDTNKSIFSSNSNWYIRNNRALQVQRFLAFSGDTTDFIIENNYIDIAINKTYKPQGSHQTRHQYINNTWKSWAGEIGQSSTGGRFAGLNNTVFERNTWTNAAILLKIDGQGLDGVNVTFHNNSFNNGDIGVRIDSVKGYIFTNNTFVNNTHPQDVYEVGLLVVNSSNITIENNKFYETSFAIACRGCSNSTIINNTFDLVSLADAPNYDFCDGNEPRSPILIQYTFKSYTPGWCGYENYNNVSCRRQFKTSNIRVLDNTFDADTQVFMKAVGVENLTHDMDDYPYYFWKMNPLNTWSDSFYMWINNDFDTLTNFNCSWYSGINRTSYRNHRYETPWMAYGSSSNVGKGYNYPFNNDVWYTVSKNNITIELVADNPYNMTWNSSLNEVNYTILVGQSPMQNERDTCTLPEDGVLYTDERINACDGNYYFDDIISFNRNGGTYWDMRGGTYNGDGVTHGFQLNNRDVGVITNGTLVNYDRAIWLNSKDRFNISNMVIKNSIIGIRMSDVQNSTITNITIFDMDEKGINLALGSKENVLSNLRIHSVGQQAIDVETLSYSNNITGVFANTTGQGYQSINLNNVSSCFVMNSIVNNSGWNSFDVSGENNTIFNVTGINPVHYNFDMCDDDFIAVRTTAYNMTLIGAGIYLCSGNNNLIFNSSVNNTINVSIGYGIALEGNNTDTFNNNYTSIQIFNATKTCVLNSVDSTRFVNITMDTCNNSDYRIESWFEDRRQISSATIIDTVYINGVSTFDLRFGVEINVNDSSSLLHNISLPNADKFKFRYSGKKDLQIINNTVSFVGTARNTSTTFNLDCPTYLKIKNDLFFDSYNFNAPCNVYIESGGKLHTE